VKDEELYNRNKKLKLNNKLMEDEKIETGNVVLNNLIKTVHHNTN
jgi:hypothetical protein